MPGKRFNIARFGGLVGASPAMAKVFEMVERAAQVSVPVLVEGETGTGKELVAREIHARSALNTGPFVAVNTGALSPDLVASELFGHVKGSFTGASEDRSGRFAEADGGTLFLDEIATMTERVQVVFLRVLDEGVFRPVGGEIDKKVNVRIVAATNANLRQMVESGQFREDLLQRLTVFRILLPPLREHLEDLGMLSYHFLALVAEEFGLAVDEISDEAFSLLGEYPWPGNIRELRNAIAQAAIMAGQGAILPEHIPPRIVSSAHHEQPTPSPATTAESAPVNASNAPCQQCGGVGVVPPAAREDSFVVPFGLRMEEVQKAYVKESLARCGSNKTATARLLGISRKTLHDWLARWSSDGNDSSS